MSHYYKAIDKVCLSGDRFSGLSIGSDMKKRGVDKTSCKIVENDVIGVQLESFHEVSGAVEYGLGVILTCYLSSGDSVRLEEDGMKYLSWVKKYDVHNGYLEGNFVLLFKGVVVELEEVGSKVYKSFIRSYDKQELKKTKVSNLEIEPGDIVNIYGKSLYLGSFYYYKPSFRNEEIVNKLRKYKIYIVLESDGSLSDEIKVEAGKTRYNQVTKVLGQMDFDMDLLVEEAKAHLSNILHDDVGYRTVKNLMGKGYIPYNYKNEKSYVLCNIEKTKDNIKEPDLSFILRLGWLCKWNYSDKYIYLNTGCIPYEYKIKSKK